MSEAYLSAVIEDCVRALRAGASREDCLRAYPEMRRDLEPVLEAAIALQGEPRARFGVTEQARVRDRLMRAIATEPHRRPALLPSFDLRLAFVPALAALVAIVFVLAQGSFFAGSNVAEAGPILTVLKGEVLVETDEAIVTGRSGMLLEPDDRVRTLAGALAVLTFFDGSTVTLAPETVVRIKQVGEQEGTLHAVLVQEKGHTWTYVPEGLGPADIRIETPNAAVATRNGAFGTSVDDAGTAVNAREGPVSVAGSGSSAEVSAGSQTTVDTSGTVDQPVAAPSPERELVLTIRGTSTAHVVDPSGATVGAVAPGVPVNQIQGASLQRDGDILTIRIPNPAEGAYTVGVASGGGSAVSVEAAVLDGGAATDLATLGTNAGDSWQVAFDLSGDSVTSHGAAPAASPSPPVVIPDTAADKATKATPTPQRFSPGSAEPSATPTRRPTSTPTTRPTSTLSPTPTVTPKPEPTATPAIKRPTPSAVDSAQPIANDVSTSP